MDLRDMFSKSVIVTTNNMEVMSKEDMVTYLMSGQMPGHLKGNMLQINVDQDFYEKFAAAVERGEIK